MKLLNKLGKTAHNGRTTEGIAGKNERIIADCFLSYAPLFCPPSPPVHFSLETNI